MGCGKKKAAEDEEDYHDLCTHFGESAGDGPYSEHAKLLKKLYAEERKLHEEHKVILRHRRAALKKLTPVEKRALGLMK